MLHDFSFHNKVREVMAEYDLRESTPLSVPGRPPFSSLDAMRCKNFLSAPFLSMTIRCSTPDESAREQHRQIVWYFVGPKREGGTVEVITKYWLINYSIAQFSNAPPKMDQPLFGTAPFRIL